MVKKIGLALLALLIILALLIWWMMQPDQARLSNAELTGRVPVLSAVRPQILPTIKVSNAIGWPRDGAPVAAQGLSVARFADGLDHPRAMHVLPNGDVLVVESNSARRTKTGIEGFFENQIMGKAGATVESANRITLLRDADGDGVAEVKTPFLTGLNSPYGVALIGSTLYVANTDALMAFDYRVGETSITTPGRKIIDLPASGENRHWTKSMVAMPDGRLMIGIGSNSNIGDSGMAWERGRAMVIEVIPGQSYKRTFASGLRNPAGLAVHPSTGQLWADVNERDMLGSDMVPDYLTELELGQNFGWPWYYWGGFLDDRVKEPDLEDRRQYIARPDYALGAHVAPLGMSFATNPALGEPFTNGAFIALHGSWNRSPQSGYKVIYVAFGADGKPADALPLDILTGFTNAEGQAMGRPTDARQAKDGALLVADDVGNTIWRVVRR